MLKRALLSLVLLTIPLPAVAQEGVILYQRAVKNEFDLPEDSPFRDRLPGSRTDNVLLIFRGTESLMLPAPRGAGPEGGGENDRRSRFFAEFMRRNSAERSAQETIVETYTNSADATSLEAREFMGRTFLISDDQSTVAWKLAGEEREFLGYMVQKATADPGGIPVEAWFTPQIPVSSGPGGYGGLPGMILMLNVGDGQTVYSAAEVDLTGVAEGTIVRPDDGRIVTRAEYEEIVAEKLKELEAVRGSGDRRPFP